MSKSTLGIGRRQLLQAGAITAALRPSKIITTRAFVVATHSCSFTNSKNN
jgi:hypothetical protein